MSTNTTSGRRTFNGTFANSTATGMRHYENQNSHPAMLFFDSIALGLSASMTLMACFAVFKWSAVKKRANHGTLFMMFLSLSMWSMSKLVLINIAEFNMSRDMWVGKRQIMYVTLVSDMFFNATSMWCILATYEFQRWVWRPRVHSRNIMLWYNLLVQSICIAHVVAITVIDMENPPKNRDGWRRRNTTIPRSLPPGVTRRPWVPPPTLIWMENMFWIIYGFRWLAVLYPIALGVAFSFCQRSKAMNRQGSIRIFVILLLLLNTPYLVLEPLFDFNVLDKTQFLIVYSLSKCATYFTGVGVVNLLGLYLSDFDTLYTSKDSPRGTASSSAFLVFDTGRVGHTRTLVRTRE